jgi:hypothetical protein
LRTQGKLTNYYNHRFNKRFIFQKPQKRTNSSQSLQRNTSDASLAPSSTIINIRRAIALLEGKHNASKAAAAAATAASNAAAAAESAAKKINGKPPKKEKDPDAPKGLTNRSSDSFISYLRFYIFVLRSNGLIHDVFQRDQRTGEFEFLILKMMCY